MNLKTSQLRKSYNYVQPGKRLYYTYHDVHNPYLWVFHLITLDKRCLLVTFYANLTGLKYLAMKLRVDRVWLVVLCLHLLSATVRSSRTWTKTLTAVSRVVAPGSTVIGMSSRAITIDAINQMKRGWQVIAFKRRNRYRGHKAY